MPSMSLIHKGKAEEVVRKQKEKGTYYFCTDPKGRGKLYDEVSLNTISKGKRK